MTSRMQIKKETEMEREETRKYIAYEERREHFKSENNQAKYVVFLGPLTVFHELGFETCSLCLKEVLLSVKEPENGWMIICFDMF